MSDKFKDIKLEDFEKPINDPIIALSYQLISMKYVVGEVVVGFAAGPVVLFLNITYLAVRLPKTGGLNSLRNN